MRRPYLLLLCCSLAFRIASSQAVLRPVPSQTHRLATAQSITVPIKCDSEGDTYFRFPSSSPSTFDLVKLSQDGSEKAKYRYYDLPDLKNAFVEDFAIADDGKVYELAQISGRRMFVIRFSPDGQFDNKTELLTDETVSPSQLVVMNDGNIFVSGTKIGNKDGHAADLPPIFVHVRIRQL